MNCEHCGKDIEDVRFCPYCGTEEEGFSPQAEGAKGGTAEEIKCHDEASPAGEGKAEERRAGMSRGKKLLIANCTLCVILIVLVGAALGTAVRWEKVDVPEHKETFHVEERDTGAWKITMDEKSPCYVGQAWEDCINARIAEYNNACVGRTLTGSPGDPSVDTSEGGFMKEILKYGTDSYGVCARYKESIEAMQSQQYGYVASPGTMGHLHAEKHYEEVEVSNNDFMPAQTHDAVCYFGFLGECDFEKKES